MTTRYDAKSTELADAVLEFLAGRRDNKESISFLMSALRDRGWRNIGRLSEFERWLTDAGFTVERVYVQNSNCVRATYVSL